MGGVEDIKVTSLVCPLVLVGLGHYISSLSIMQPVQLSAPRLVGNRFLMQFTKSTIAILVYDGNFEEIIVIYWPHDDRMHVSDVICMYVINLI